MALRMLLPILIASFFSWLILNYIYINLFFREGLDQPSPSPSPQPSSVPVSPGDQAMLTSQLNSLMKTAQELKLEQIANKLKLVANEGHINKMKEEQDKMKSEMEEIKKKEKNK